MSKSKLIKLKRFDFISKAMQFLATIIYVTVIMCMIPQLAAAQISTPQGVSDLIFWVDATDVNGTGVQPTNGSTITTWVTVSAARTILRKTAANFTNNRSPTTRHMALTSEA